MPDAPDPAAADPTVRRGGLFAVMDAALLVTLPATCVLLALALGWTYAYLTRPALLVGALAFAAAAVASFVSLRSEPSRRSSALLGAAALLAVAGFACLVVGAR